MKSSVIERLQKHLKEHPDKIIIQDYQRTWTWKELFLRASDYASAIQGKTLHERIVPFLADRTGESIATMLGCLLSDLAFAPLSVAQPQDRLEKCLRSLKATILLRTSAGQPEWDIPGVQQIHPGKLATQVKTSTGSYFKDQEIIYVLFTSGSTGVPKGVLISAGNIDNTMKWSESILDWREDDVVGVATNFFFDISIFDVFTMMYFNVPLAIYSNTTDTHKVAEETLRFKITSVFSVPLFFSQFSKLELAGRKSHFPLLRRIISGGDFFPPEHMLRWLELSPHTQIYNVWGPTETSIVNTMHLVSFSDLPRLKEGKSPPVGKSHPLMEYVLVDSDRKTLIQEPNRIGEIAMLGPCVSQGYLNAADLTAQAYSIIDGQRCFFTQDLGSRDENDNLFITGRLGSTVKVSGYRVDLGEIDSKAVQFPGIHLASTFVKRVNDDINELWLVAELTEKANALDIFEFKTFLRSGLPHYMVPKKIFVTESLPLNQNGKIDRQKVREGIYE